MAEQRGTSPPSLFCHPSFNAAQDAVDLPGSKSKHCLRLVILSIRTPKLFFAGLLTMSSFPSLYTYLRLPWPKCNTPCTCPYWTSFGSRGATFQACPGLSGWHPFLLLCQLHHSAWSHQWSCWEYTRYIPLPVSFIKMLKITGPNTDPWGTLLMTGLCLDAKLLTTNISLVHPCT